MPCVRTDSACAAVEENKLEIEAVMEVEAVQSEAEGAKGRSGERFPSTVLTPSEHLVQFTGDNDQSMDSLLQVSAHRPGRALLRELKFVFPHYVEHCLAHNFTAAHAPASNPVVAFPGSVSDAVSSTALNRPNVAALLEATRTRRAPADFADNLLVVKTFQRSQSDLMVVSEASNAERNLLLECFSSWGRYVITRIRSHGFWADMTDPASGYPVYTPRGTSLYPDVDGSSILLKYPTHLVGCCRIVSHPVWGTRNYPATLFTTCPPELLASILSDSYQSHHRL
ncbi:hypothetical protein BC830DRAFT_380064 [Chytriomyces sp. MP71]|nr:hypothetical protein BC830DRAFT_380064 [Chytriomyces sp. MP71]